MSTLNREAIYVPEKHLFIPPYNTLRGEGDQVVPTVILYHEFMGIEVEETDHCMFEATALAKAGMSLGRTPDYNYTTHSRDYTSAVNLHDALVKTGVRDVVVLVRPNVDIMSTFMSQGFVVMAGELDRFDPALAAEMTYEQSLWIRRLVDWVRVADLPVIGLPIGFDAAATDHTV